MVDDSSLEYVVSADINDLVNDLRRGVISVEQITQKMVQFQKKLDESFSTSDKAARLNKELERTLRVVKDLSSVFGKSPQVLSLLRQGYVGKMGKDGPDLLPGTGTVRETSLARQIHRINTAEDQISARLTQARLTAHKRSLAGQEQVFNAALEQQKLATERLLARSTTNATTAQKMKIAESIARLEREMTPENLAASTRLHQYTLDQRRANAVPELIAARRIKADMDRQTAQTNYTDPAFIRGRQAINAEQYQRTVRAGQVGSAQASLEYTLDRVNADGGAGIAAVQTRLMVGYAALAGAMNIARNLSTFVVQLDKEFKQFQAITNTTAGEMDGVKKQLIAVSETTKFTALEVAEAATIMGQAGLSAQNIGQSIEAVTLLATAAGSDLKETVENVTSTLSIFNLEADQAANIANTFTAALNGSKLSMDRITLGLQYAGNTAAQFGVTYQELTASLGAMANAGIKSGSTLGTGMRMLLVSLTEPTKKFREQLEAVGLTTADVDVKSKGLLGVLQTLKDAGFGASEAYKAFEVRAASAFAAMSNNLDVAFKLEESFIGSTAAMKANETQMEALANQYARFQSAVGTAAYNAMGPLIDFLTDGVKVAADFASALNRIPGVLKVISVAAAGTMSAVLLRTLLGVGRGMMAGLGIAKLTADIKAATGAMAIFNTVVRANPLIFWASAAAAAATAVYAFTNRTSELEKKLQATEALISRSKQNIETLGQGIASVDQTINNLRERQAHLDSDPLARRLRIDEVLQQFSELGTYIDSSTSSVEDLVTALKELKSVKFSEQIRDYAEIIRESQDLKNLYLDQADKVGPVDVSPQLTRESLGGSAFNLAKQWGIIPQWSNFYANRDALPNIYRDLLTAVPSQRQIDTQFNSSDAQYLIQLSADPRLAIEGSPNAKWGEIKDRLSTFRTSTATELSTLKTQLDKNPDDPALKKSMAELLELYSFVDKLVQSTDPLLDLAIQYQQTIRNIEQAEIAKDTTTYRAITDASMLTHDAGLLKASVDSLTGEADAIINAPDQTAIVKETAAENLRLYLDTLTNSWQYAQDKLVDELVAAGMSRDDALAQADQVLQPFYAARVAAEDLIASTGKEVLKTTAESLTARLSLAKSQLSKDVAKLKSAKTSDQTKAYADVARATQEAVWELQDEIFRRELSNPEHGPEKIEALINQHAADVEAHEEALAEIAAQAIQTARDIESAAIKGSIESLKAQEAEIVQQIEAINKQIEEGANGVNFENLSATLATLFSRLRDLTSFRLDQEQQLGTVTGDGSALAWLAQRESGGNFGAVNQYGYTGRLQFGDARLTDFRRAMGVNFTKEQFGKDPALQESVERWHVEDHLNTIRRKYAPQIGKEVMGVIMDEAAMLGVMHLKGEGGLQDLLAGRVTTDGNGTSTLEYARAMSGKSLDVDAWQASARTGAIAATTASNQIDENERKANIALQTRALEGDLDASTTAIAAAMSKARAKFTPAAYQELSAALDRRDAIELSKFDLKGGSDTERNQLVRELARKRYDSIMDMFNQQIQAEDDAADDALTEAQTRLQIMQRPGSGFSDAEIRQAESAVRHQERLKQATDLANLEGRVGFLKREQAKAAQEYGAESEAALLWNERIAEVDRQRLELAKQLNLERSLEGQGGDFDPIQAGTDGWKMSTGVFEYGSDGKIKMVDVAKQTAEAWQNVLEGLQGGFETFFMDVATGFDGLGNALRSFGAGVFKMLAQMLARALAFKVVMGLTSSIPGLGGMAQFLTPGYGMAAAGNPRIPGIPGRDSVPYLLEPGEAVLRRSAVSIVGEDNIKNLNNLGNRVQNPTLAWTPPQEKDGGTVNVWVVTPDQQPPMTEKDIIAVINNDIMNRGSVKKMIQSVQMGQV